MAAVFVDPKRTHAFESAAAFERWLSKHYVREPELWIKRWIARCGRSPRWECSRSIGTEGSPWFFLPEVRAGLPAGCFHRATRARA